MENDIETRAWAECRVEASDDRRRIRGYAVVFNSLSLDVGGFKEIIAPEAVDRALGTGADIRALLDHDPGKVLGRTRAGTLKLRKDSRGLAIEIEPNLEVSYARDAMHNVARGDLSGMSFKFKAIEDSWNYDKKMPIRTVHDMEIREVSIVAFPAYEATDVQVAMRSMREGRPAGRSLKSLAQWHRTQCAR